MAGFFRALFMGDPVLRDRSSYMSQIASGGQRYVSGSRNSLATDNFRRRAIADLRTPGDMTKRADEWVQQGRRYDLFNLIVGASYYKSDLLSGLSPVHVKRAADFLFETQAHEGLATLVSVTAHKEFLRAGLMPKHITDAMNKMDAGRAAYVIYALADDARLRFAITFEKVRECAEKLSPYYLMNNFIYLLAASDIFPPWRPILNEAMQANGVSYAIRANGNLGKDHMLGVYAAPLGTAIMNVLGPEKLDYFSSIKPEKAFEILVRPVEADKTEAEKNRLRQGVVDALRGAMRELAMRYPHNTALRAEAERLDTHIAKLGLTVPAAA